MSWLVVWHGIPIRHLTRDTVGMWGSIAGRSIVVAGTRINLWLGVAIPLPRRVRCSMVVVAWHSGVALVRHWKNGLKS